MTDTPPTTEPTLPTVEDDAYAPPPPGGVDYGAATIDEEAVGYYEWIPFAERPEFQGLGNVGHGARGDGAGFFTNGLDQTRINDRIAQLHELMKMAGGNIDLLSPEWVKETYGQGVAEDIFGIEFDTPDGAPVAAGSYIDYGFTKDVSPWMQRANNQMAVVNEFAGATNFEQQAAFVAMSGSDLANFKELMWSAGYYDSDRPSWIGGVTAEDRAAFMRFQQDQNANPDEHMDVVVARAQARTLESAMRSDELFMSAQDEIQLEKRQRAQRRAITGTDPNTVAEVLRNFAETEFGYADMDQEILDEYARQGVAAENASKQAYYDLVDSYDDDTLGGLPVEEIDLFLQAAQDEDMGMEASNSLGTVFDGQYKMADRTWQMLAPTIGMNPADRTPANELLAARVLAANLYNRNGQSWEATAAQWRSLVTPPVDGPRRYGFDNALSRRTANQTTYVPNVLNRMKETQEMFLSADDLEGGGGGTTIVTQVDPTAAAKRAMRAAYATERQSWKFAGKGAEFFRMIAEGSRI